MIVGMHFSVAGKYYNAVEKAHELGCNALQIFAQNPKGWRVKEFADGEVNTFRRLVSEHAIEAVVVHTPYLINLASPNGKLVWQSRRAVKTSLQRADLLGAQFVVTHIGSARGRDLGDALTEVSRGLDEILEDDHEALLLLENTAGSGHIVGSQFEGLARIIDRSKVSDRLYVCLDTAHAFAAGYDVATSDGLNDTLAELDRLIGLDRLKVVHANDTKVALGSHVDRHWHIGKGNIGLEGFRNIVNHPKLAHLPFILETPV
jgi:deoxyribonuclease-4